MYKHIVEAFIPLPSAESVAETICFHAKIYCRSVMAIGNDRHLNFSDARVIMRPSGKRLFFRIEAKDIVSLYGIQTLLQGHLYTTVTISDGAIEWYSAR